MTHKLELTTHHYWDVERHLRSLVLLRLQPYFPAKRFTVLPANGEANSTPVRVDMVCIWELSKEGEQLVVVLLPDPNASVFNYEENSKFAFHNLL